MGMQSFLNFLRGMETHFSGDNKVSALSFLNFLRGMETVARRSP